MNDLQKRIISFSGDIYRLSKDLNKDNLLENTLRQINKSCTSVGANYSEAQSAISIKDFHNKVRIALKEMKETNYWLNYLINIKPEIEELNILESESLELLKIIRTISKKTDPKLNPPRSKA